MTPEHSSSWRPEDQRAFWDYTDLAFFAGLMVPTLLAALGVTRIAMLAAPVSKGVAALLMQSLWYVFLFGSLVLIFRVRYGKPLLPSLGWRFPFRGIVLCVAAGPVMAIAVGLIGYLIHTPTIKLPLFDEMRADLPTEVLFGLFAAGIGPLCEELAFRGFLMPLLAKSFGWVSAIISTGLLFGMLHAYEYQWSWRHVLLISIVGCVLGWVRYTTGSTAASTLLHATYNLTQLAGFLAQPK